MADENKYMLVSLQDEESKEIAEVIGSKTCKRIINYLAEKEASQKDLSDELKIPLNTIEYNIKKLLSTGFIQKTKNFFWSKKGKKIPMYKLSNKSIIISHKKSVTEKIKSILPAFILSIAGTVAIAAYEKIKNVPEQFTKADEILYSAQALARNSATNLSIPLWLIFAIGSLLAIITISIVNWRKL